MIKVSRAEMERRREAQAREHIRADAYYEPFYCTFYFSRSGRLVLVFPDSALTEDRFYNLTPLVPIDVEFIP